MNAGHFYGKVVDEKTGKGIEFAAVQLMQTRRTAFPIQPKKRWFQDSLHKQTVISVLKIFLYLEIHIENFRFRLCSL